MRASRGGSVACNPRSRGSLPGGRGTWSRGLRRTRRRLRGGWVDLCRGVARDVLAGLVALPRRLRSRRLWIGWVDRVADCSNHDQQQEGWEEYHGCDCPATSPPLAPARRRAKGGSSWSGRDLWPRGAMVCPLSTIPVPQPISVRVAVPVRGRKGHASHAKRSITSRLTISGSRGHSRSLSLVPRRCREARRRPRQRGNCRGCDDEALSVRRQARTSRRH